MKQRFIKNHTFINVLYTPAYYTEFHFVQVIFYFPLSNRCWIKLCYVVFYEMAIYNEDILVKSCTLRGLKPVEKIHLGRLLCLCPKVENDHLTTDFNITYIPKLSSQVSSNVKKTVVVWAALPQILEKCIMCIVMGVIVDIGRDFSRGIFDVSFQAPFNMLL